MQNEYKASLLEAEGGEATTLLAGLRFVIDLGFSSF